jgi:hypothetical protein
MSGLLWRFQHVPSRQFGNGIVVRQQIGSR